MSRRLFEHLKREGLWAEIMGTFIEVLGCVEGGME